jgi:peptide methionine sulfoxide reductase MsrB
VSKAKAEWKKLLAADAYQVLFEDGTERAGSSALNNEKRAGTYLCAACNLPLFDSAHKYESGTGWPSFWQPLPGALGTATDFKLIYPRTEYHCSRCGGTPGPRIQRRPATDRQSATATMAWPFDSPPAAKPCRRCAHEVHARSTALAGHEPALRLRRQCTTRFRYRPGCPARYSPVAASGAWNRTSKSFPA